MTTGTADNLNQDTTKAKEVTQVTPTPGTGLEKEQGGAETKPEKTYRQSEVDALLGKAGQRIQAKLDAVTTERDSLKGQVDTLTADITEAKVSIVSLTKDIEAMSEDDPDKKGLLKLRKEKEEELKTLKAEKAAIANDKTEIAKWKRDQLVFTVADEFVKADGEKVDFDSFMTAADKFKLSEREGLETLAETMGFKPKLETTEPATPPTPPVVPYSGMTDGGQGELTEKQKLARRYPTMNIK